MNPLSVLRREMRFLSGALRLAGRVRHLSPDGPANVADVLEASVDRHGSRTAILFEDDRWTYDQWDARANRYAHWAIATGLRPGENVALFMENCPDYLAIWFGLAKVGVATALINNQLTGRSLAHCVALAETRHVIVGASLCDAWTTTTGLVDLGIQIWSNGDRARGFRDLETGLISAAATRPDRARRAAQTARDLALLIYTSGTTGLPKAARITHLRALMTMHSFAAVTNAGPRDVIYAPLPLYHAVGGVCAPGIALLTGGAIALRRSFSVAGFWSDCVRYEATLFQYVGELCRYLVNGPPDPDERRHGLRLVVGNGLRPEVWDRFQARFAIPRILEFYGATESNLTLFNLDGHPHAVGRAPAYLGKAINVSLVRFDPDLEVPVRNGSGHCEPCADGEVGEAIARIDPTRATMRFEGYSEAEATSKKILRNVFEPGDAYFRSGDLMRRDRAGYFYFVDRIGDTFRWKGENVATSEVSQVACGVAGVLEANAYGVEVAGQGGRAGMLSLVVDPDRFDPASLRETLHRELPPYARPLFVRLTDHMEITGTFKHKKTDAVKEGFDPDRIADTLWFDDPRGRAYDVLTPALHRQILSGEIRL